MACLTPDETPRAPASATVSPKRALGRLIAGRGGLAAALLWATAASYLVVSDVGGRRLLDQQAAMRAAYETRLADLEAALDRGRGTQEGLREGLAARLAAVTERQAELERRQAALARLPGAGAAEPSHTGAIAPQPEMPGLGLRRGEGAPERRSALDVEAGLVVLEARLDRVQAALVADLGQRTERTGRTLRRLHALIGRTGLDVARSGVAAMPAGLGGPLVPISGDAFAVGLSQVQRLADEEARLQRLAAALPLRRPLAAPVTVSSGFGTRQDPFTRGLALHTGLDFKAEFGEAARATAPGRVTLAEASGGYGNLVEIDHGFGLTTRFAHLGRVGVIPGQSVRAGDLVGLVGSTGRSTGAHLHYETRIDGEPVDPVRFLEAGRSAELWVTEFGLP